MSSRLLQELRAAWLALGLLLGLTLAWPGPVLLGLTLIGPKRLRAVWQKAVALGGAIVVVCAGLEGVLRLPFFEERFGSPAATRAWERRYDRVAEENVFGFRTAHQLRRAPGVPRILALGDPPVGDPNFMRRLGKPPAVLKGGALQSSALAHLLRVKYWETLVRRRCTPT